MTYDVSYMEDTKHRVIRLHTDRGEAESIKWLEDHMGAKNVILREAETSDMQSGKMIVRI